MPLASITPLVGTVKGLVVNEIRGRSRRMWNRSYRIRRRENKEKEEEEQE